MSHAAEDFYARDRAEWREWLKANNDRVDAVWLVFDKGEHRTLSYDEIVEEALCFGWIDSRPGKVDDRRSKLYISRRKPRSAWSRSNKQRVAKLKKAGQMAEPGLAAVAVAKKNGAWDALNKSDKLELPDELTRLLNRNKRAREYFDSLSPAVKRTVLEWIYAAKTEPTREKRIRETAELAAKGITANR